MAAMRGKQLIGRALQVQVALPSQEPMLWAADVVAGAVGAARVHGASYLGGMEHRITEIEIELR